MSTEASTAANFMVAAGGDLSNERQAGCCGGGSRNDGSFPNAELQRNNKTRGI